MHSIIGCILLIDSVFAAFALVGAMVSEDDMKFEVGFLTIETAALVIGGWMLL